MHRYLLTAGVCILLGACGGSPRDPAASAWEQRERQAGRLVGGLFEAADDGAAPKLLALVRTDDGRARGTGELAVVSVPSGYAARWPGGMDARRIPPGHFIRESRRQPKYADASSSAHHWLTAHYLLRPHGELPLFTQEYGDPHPNPVPLADGRTLFAVAGGPQWSGLVIDRGGELVAKADVPVSGATVQHVIGSLLVLASAGSGNLLLDPRTLQPIPGPPLVVVRRYGTAAFVAVRDGDGAAALIGPDGPVAIALPGRLIPHHVHAETAQRHQPGGPAWEVTHWFVESAGQRVGVLTVDGTVVRRDLQWAEGVQVVPTIRAADGLQHHSGFLLHGADGAWRVMWAEGDMPDSPPAESRQLALQSAVGQRTAYNAARINAHNQAALAQIHADLARAAAARQRQAEEADRRARLAALGPEYRASFDSIRAILAAGPVWTALQRLEGIDPAIARGADAVAWDRLRRDVAQAVLDKRDALCLRAARDLVEQVQRERDPPTALPLAGLTELGTRLASLELELMTARFTAPPPAAGGGSGLAYQRDWEADARHRVFMAETRRAIDDLRRSTR